MNSINLEQRGICLRKNLGDGTEVSIRTITVLQSYKRQDNPGIKSLSNLPIVARDWPKRLRSNQTIHGSSA